MGLRHFTSPQLTQTLDQTPGAPKNFVAAVVSSTALRLTWAPDMSKPPPDDYDLDFSTVSSSGPWTSIPVGAATLYDHTGQDVTQRHWYRLVAKNGPYASPSVFADAANLRPIFSVAPTSAIIPATGGTIQFTAYDPEGGGVTYSLSARYRPDITVNPSTGLVSIPVAAQGTSGSVTVRATDSVGLFADTLCSIEVLSVPVGVDLTVIRAAGYIVVTDYAGVDATGVGDSTAGLRNAIEGGRANKKPLYFPSGTYLISDSLIAGQWIVAPQSGDGNLHNWIGCSTSRPVIKLKAGSSGFGNASDPKPMIAFRAWDGTGTYGAMPSHPLDNPTGFIDAYGVGFHNSMENFIIDTNQQAGAIGYTFSQCQNSWTRSIKVIATNSFAGAHGLGGTNGSDDIEIIGGQYGVYYGQLRETPAASGVSITGLRCFDQTVACFRFDDYCPTVIVGFHFRKSGSGSVVYVHNAGSNTNWDNFALIDGIIETSGGIAIVNPNSTAYLRNVYFTGTDQLIQKGSRSVITGSGTWKCVVEYSCTNMNGHSHPFIEGETAIAHKTMLNGTVSFADELVINVQSGATPPSSTLWSRHLISKPYLDDGQPYADVKSYGAQPWQPSTGWWETGKTCYRTDYEPPKDATQPDSLAAINAAIVAAETAGHNRVFMPRGVYFISGPIQLRAHTKLFGASQFNTVIASKYTWVPTTGSPYMIETVDSAAGTGHVSNFQICTRSQGGGTDADGRQIVDRFSHILWRLGRNSSSHAVENERQYYDETKPTNARRQWTFSGSGGGKHYYITGGQRGDCHNDFRVMLATGTTEPLTLYSPNTEGSKAGPGDIYSNWELWDSNANFELNNAQNVRIYGGKREGNSRSLWIRSSSNVAHYGNGVALISPHTHAYYTVEGTSSNILIAVATVQDINYSKRGFYYMYEAINGQPINTIEWQEGIALYKRGAINDGAMFS